MTEIFLLDHRAGIFQSFQDANAIFAFCNRSSHNLKGKTLVVRNGSKSRIADLGVESPKEIHALTIKLQNEIK